jgi:hypothetical protein
MAEKPNLILRARNAATAALIDAHTDEYHDLMERECKTLGVAWSRPLSAEDKARAEVEALLTKYPHLRDEFAPGTFDTPAPKAFATV